MRKREDDKKLLDNIVYALTTYKFKDISLSLDDKACCVLGEDYIIDVVSEIIFNYELPNKEVYKKIDNIVEKYVR